jgi:hypothetical protein
MMDALQTVCLGTLFATTAAAQHQRPLAQSIPASAHAVVQFAGLADCRNAWCDHGLAPIVHDAFERLGAPHRKKLLEPWRRELAPKVRRALRRIGIGPATIRALLRGPCALVVGRPTVASGKMVPSIAILLDVSDAVTSADRVVSRMAALAGRGRMKEEVIQGVATRIIHVDNPGVRRIYAGTTGRRLVVSNSRGLFTEILTTARGRGRSVAMLAAYRVGRKHLKGRALGSIWVNTQPWMVAARPFLPYEAESIGAALGLGELRGVFVAAGTDGSLGTEVCHIGLPGEAGGLFRAAFKGSVSLDTAALCSPDTIAFVAMRLDAATFLRGLRGMFARLPGWMRTELENELGDVTRGLDKIGKHVSVLTGDFAVACSSPKAVPIPEVTLFVGVRGQDQVTQELRRVMQRRHGASLNSQKFLDVDIHHVTVTVKGVGLAPCFACKDGVLMISTHPRILKATLRRWQKKGPSLRDRPDWQAAARRARGCNSLVYVATGEVARRLMGTPQVARWLRTRLLETGLNPNILPEADDLGRALSSIVVTTRIDRDGFTMVSRSPVFEGSVLAAAGFALDRALRDLIGRNL